MLESMHNEENRKDVTLLSSFETNGISFQSLLEEILRQYYEAIIHKDMY